MADREYEHSELVKGTKFKGPTGTRSGPGTTPHATSEPWKGGRETDASYSRRGSQAGANVNGPKKPASVRGGNVTGPNRGDRDHQEKHI